jgi:hypothetical protein
VVVMTQAELSGDEVSLEWRIDERNPAEESTRVFYKSTGPGEGWKETPAGSVSKRTCRFKPDAAGAITVQVVTMGPGQERRAREPRRRRPRGGAGRSVRPHPAE